MSKDKRGQAALEFLTTYGWAFLVILIMISALAYFGVLSPQNFLPERCNVQAEFQCDDFSVVASGDNLNTSLALRNQVGTEIIVHNMSFDTAPEEVSGTTNCNIGGGTTLNIPASGSEILSCEAQGNFPSTGQKQRLGFEIVYQEVGGSFNHTVTGEVYATIQG